jgi:hypothetical protein
MAGKSKQAMDETGKIIIATISGFTVAFFAEPIKLYFQNAHNKRIFPLRNVSMI